MTDFIKLQFTYFLCFSFRNAGKPEILKKFRKLAAKWHPDRFSDPEEKKKAEKKFIDIAAAKEVLSDPGMCVYL